MGRLWKLVLNLFVSLLANYSVQVNGESITHLPLTVYISVSKTSPSKMGDIMVFPKRGYQMFYIHCVVSALS